MRVYLRTLLLNLKGHKASGPDEIPTTLLKLLQRLFSSVLTMIFQYSVKKATKLIKWPR